MVRRRTPQLEIASGPEAPQDEVNRNGPTRSGQSGKPKVEDLRDRGTQAAAMAEAGVKKVVEEVEKAREAVAIDGKNELFQRRPRAVAVSHSVASPAIVCGAVTRLSKGTDRAAAER